MTSHTIKISSPRKNRCIHIALILASLILPVTPILIIVFTGHAHRRGFTLSRAPPILCTGIDIDTNFWAFLFPLSLVLGLGTTLLVLILRTVIKVVIIMMFTHLLQLLFILLETCFVQDLWDKGHLLLDTRIQGFTCSMLLCYHWGCSSHHHYPCSGSL